MKIQLLGTGTVFITSIFILRHQSPISGDSSSVSAKAHCRLDWIFKLETFIWLKLVQYGITFLIGL